MAGQKSRALKVGIFAVIGMAIATVMIFLIGDNRRQWDSKTTFKARFSNVAGLKTGTSVRIGGIDVGSVTKVAHADDPKDMTIYVTFAVSNSEAARVKPDTVAHVAARGLLGDKMIELTGGALDSAPAGEGTFIASELEPPDMSKALADMQDAVKVAKVSLENVRVATERIADPQFSNDLHGTVKSLNDILDGVAHKPGLLNRMIYDPEEAQKFDRILTNLDSTSSNLVRVSADARDITARTKTGPGIAHTILYDEKSATKVAGTLAEVHDALSAMRTGNGIGHTVIYGDDEGSSQHMMTNFAKMSDDMMDMVASVKAGRGTLGGLLVDPSVYEDVKSLVGNVERNQVLRALVRYSIKKEDAARAEVKEQKN